MTYTPSPIDNTIPPGYVAVPAEVVAELKPEKRARFDWRCDHCGADRFTSGQAFGAHVRFCEKNPNRAVPKAKRRKPYKRKAAAVESTRSDLALVTLTVFPKGLPTTPAALDEALDWVVATAKHLATR